MIKCKVCGYEWIPRVENPKQCPNMKCQSYDYATGKQPLKYKMVRVSMKSK